ncbi:hypothetical protein H0O00_00805 [Candidatus Micrarchaeota archaeon]|nr:hypothetical protein [Candidatus Micrarchaeota archaeon]
MDNAQTARVPATQMVPALSMANRFGKYKPMEEKAVRKVEVVGDELSYLRQRREMLRSMTPEQVLQVIEFHENLNVFQALELAKKEKKLIVPNDVHDRILTETKVEYSAWVGTAVIYEAPDAPFKDRVVYAWEDNEVEYATTFNIPQQFRGKTNCALVVEHPDFQFISLGDNKFQLKAAEGSVSLLEHFSNKSDEWYKYDKRFRIPTGTPKNKTDSTRWLWRQGNGYVGLVARGFGGYDVRRGVALDYAPSGAFGVAVF